MFLLVFFSTFCLKCRPDKTSVLVQGPYLVREASITSNRTLALKGDIDNSTEPIAIFAPSVTSVTWNGKPVTITSQDGNLLYATLDGPPDFTLPALGPWKWHDSLPEIQANYTTSTIAWIGQFSPTPWFNHSAVHHAY